MALIDVEAVFVSLGEDDESICRLRLVKVALFCFELINPHKKVSQK